MIENLKYKIGLFIGGAFLASIFLYSIPKLIEYSFSKKDKSGDKVITLNNKKYLGHSFKNMFDLRSYTFIHPPVIIDSILKFDKNFEFYNGYLDNKNVPRLKIFQLMNDTLNYRIENENHPEFSARLDTLEMLIEKFKED